MKVSDLERLSRPDEKTTALAADAARALSGLDMRLVPSVAQTFHGLDTTKLGDLTAVREAAKSVESLRSVVAPQIAEALKGIDARLVAPSFSSALTGVERTSTFKEFAKALGDTRVRALIQPGFAEAFGALNLPKILSRQVADAVRDLPRLVPADLAPRFEWAAEEAVALAETRGVAEIIDESVGGFQGLSPAKRRMLATEVAVLIAAFIALAAWLFECGYMQGAGAALACAAALVRVYWRLTGKLD